MSGIKIYPTEEKKLLKSLTKEQIETLKKDNPFKEERNLLIYELRQRGVALPLLVKVTGIPKSSVHRIGRTGINRRIPIKDKALRKASLKKVQKAFNDFYKEIERIWEMESEEG